MIINPNLTEEQVKLIIGTGLELVVWRGLVRNGFSPDTAMDIILQTKKEGKNECAR